MSGSCVHTKRQRCDELNFAAAAAAAIAGSSLQSSMRVSLLMFKSSYLLNNDLSTISMTVINWALIKVAAILHCFVRSFSVGLQYSIVAIGLTALH